MTNQRKLRIVFAALAFGSLFVAVMFVQNRSKQLEARNHVAHTKEVLLEVTLLKASALDVEIASRGYILSKDRRYRDFQAAEFVAANRHLERLARLVEDSPRQVARVSRLRDVIRQRFEACRSLMELLDTRGLEAAGRSFSESDTRAHIDKLRALIADMEQEEDNLLNRRDAQLRASDRVLTLGALFAGALVVGLLFASYFLFSRDAKYRASLDEVLRQKNAELEDASRLKSEFLAHMSHELRTPLNAIIGYTGTLLMRLPGPLTADQEKQLKTIQNSGRHLLSLINEVLDLAKIESGKTDVCLEALLCCEVIEQVVSTLRPLAQAKNLLLETKFPDRPVHATTDRRSINQILINLTSNAIKFTEKGSVRIELGERNGLAAIDVIDTGIGVRLEDQPRLFQAFEQVRTGTILQEGTGLGLYLSGRLAAMIGGRIEFESEYGKGSRFTVLMPKG
jgi:signal transduction histidine kinase